MFSKIKQVIKGVISQRFEHWLKRRAPSRFQHKLSNRNIFILPTRFGFMYLFFDILLFLLGTNYQNNLILFLSYLLASLFITIMIHSFYNFSQLVFSSKAKQNCFAKQYVNFPIHVIGHKTHFDINFEFVQYPELKTKVKLAQCNIEMTEVILPWYANQRGIFDLGRVKVFSEYSFGLFITWSLLDFSHQVVVYPEPKRLPNSQNFLSSIENTENDEETFSQAFAEGDNFSELKNYILGESQARIAWKQFARGQGKFSKSYQAYQQGSLLWLTFSSMPGKDVEDKLKFLCYLILSYSNNKQSFGLHLDLPTSVMSESEVKIEPNIGDTHQKICLFALANTNNRAND